MTSEHKPRWVKDYEEYTEQMGDPIPTTAGFAATAGGCLFIALRLGIFVLFCVVVYLIGRAVVG